MAQLKRKAALVGERNGAKKVKKEDAEGLKRGPSKIAETQTDSDPIVESSTASESGEDDGVSWPSDEEEEAQKQWSQEEVEEDDEDGRIRLDANKSGTKPKKEDTGSQCGLHTPTDMSPC